MGKVLFTAVLFLAAGPGLALAGPEPASPYHAELPVPEPVSQAASAPSSDILQKASHAGDALDLVPGPIAGAPCARTCVPCGPPGCFWLSGEYLLWGIKDSRFPDLITTGVPGATALPGTLGQRDTAVLFGGSDVDNEERSGARVTGGFWLNESHTFGLEGSYFFLGARSVGFDAASTGAAGSPLIARPFFDVISGTQNAQLVAYPGLVSGNIHLSSSSRMQGAELNTLCNLCCGSPCGPECGHDPEAGRNMLANACRGWNYRVDLLGGFRYLELDEGLGIGESSQVNPALPLGSPFFGGSTITMSDQFDARNYFYGGQVGARAELRKGPLFVDVLGKLALGFTHEVVDIHGTTVITPTAGTATVIPIGFLASGSNSGRFTRDEFAVVPEIGLNVGCEITQHLRAFVGYTFLYWSSVARPGDQVDVGLSGTQIPTDTRFNPQAGPARPAALLRQTDFWAQGINVGMEFRY